jgi:hypothetical protein
MLWRLSVFPIWWSLGHVIPETSLPLRPDASKLRGFPLFTIAESRGEFIVSLGQEFIGHVAERPEIIPAKKFLPFKAFKDFKHDKESPV